MNSMFGKFIFISLSWCFSYHILNEIRHLAWDLGYGYDVKISEPIGEKSDESTMLKARSQKSVELTQITTIFVFSFSVIDVMETISLNIKRHKDTFFIKYKIEQSVVLLKAILSKNFL